jgi:hypothetical protein
VSEKVNDLAKYLNQISQNETPYEECSKKVQEAYLQKAGCIIDFLAYRRADTAQAHYMDEPREGK